MKLSDAYKKYQLEPTTYACCTFCELAWTDDSHVMGNLQCPKGCGSAVLRGVTDPKQCGCEEDVSPLEVVQEIADQQPQDPGKQVQNIHADAIPMQEN